jgi:hypothetical protein
VDYELRDTFVGYYPPIDSDYERLWKEGLVVLDTNVLLDLYRLPPVARDDLFSVLELLRDRLWIPHHVGLEFQRQRTTVIATARSATETAAASIAETLATAKTHLDALELDKHRTGAKPQELMAAVETACNALANDILRVQATQVDVGASDAVRDRIDLLLANKVGTGPTSKAELEDLQRDGEDRYSRRVPPGYADATKERNPKEATFIHDHLTYARKYGDLIIWRQLLAHTKQTGTKTVLLITGDQKEDWWWRDTGRTLGPHPELVREIRREGGVELFWMYTADRFLEYAPKYTRAQASPDSVKELKQIQETTAFAMDVVGINPIGTFGSFDIERSALGRANMDALKASVASWLRSLGAEVEVNFRGFPDLVSKRGGVLQGYEVKFLAQFDRMLFSPVIVNTMLRGYMETAEGRLADFMIVVVIPESAANAIVNDNRAEELKGRVAHLLDRYPIAGVIVGSVVDGVFQPVLAQRNLRDATSDDPWPRPDRS